MDRSECHSWDNKIFNAFKVLKHRGGLLRKLLCFDLTGVD